MPQIFVECIACVLIIFPYVSDVTSKLHCCHANDEEKTAHAGMGRRWEWKGADLYLHVHLTDVTPFFLSRLCSFSIY